MKKVILVASLFLSSLSFAAPIKYHLKTKINVNGKEVASPQIMSKGSAPAEITVGGKDGELNMIVVASDAAEPKMKNAILLKFDITYIANGKTITRTPQIMTTPGSKAEIEVGGDGSDKIQLSVIADRI